MDFKDFIKTTEAIIVLGGLFAILLLGKFWILPTAIAYIFVNVPNLYTKIMQWIQDKF